MKTALYHFGILSTAFMDHFFFSHAFIFRITTSERRFYASVYTSHRTNSSSAFCSTIGLLLAHREVQRLDDPTHVFDREQNYLHLAAHSLSRRSQYLLHMAYSWHFDQQASFINWHIEPTGEANGSLYSSDADADFPKTSVIEKALLITFSSCMWKFRCGETTEFACWTYPKNYKTATKKTWMNLIFYQLKQQSTIWKWNLLVCCTIQVPKLKGRKSDGLFLRVEKNK